MKSAKDYAKILIDKLLLREVAHDSDGEYDQARDIDTAINIAADFIEENFITEMMATEYLLAECQSSAQETASGKAFIDRQAFDLTKLLKSAERELSLRKRCYPGWVRTRKIGQDFADRETENMQNIVTLLKEVIEQVGTKQMDLFD